MFRRKKISLPEKPPALGVERDVSGCPVERLYGVYPPL